MAHAVRRPHLPQTATDQTLAVATMSLTGAAFVLALLTAWDAGAVVAALAVVVGGWSQLISRTRAERFENVLALGIAAVILAVCLAGGGGLFS